MSAFRVLRQVASVSSRVVARSGRTVPSLSARVAPRVGLSATRAFSTTPSRFSAGSCTLSVCSGKLTHSLNRTADVVFSQKLTEELKYEKESGAAEEPEFLKAFREQGVWTVRLSFSASSPYRRLLTDARLAD